MDVLLACFLLSFLSILYFSNSMLVCVCYPGWHVFRTSHTCSNPICFQLSQPRSHMCIILASMFLERAIHAFFPFLFNFSNRYFGSCFQNEPYMRSSVPFPTFPTAILHTFIISACMLNKSYGLTWPGTSLVRCSFTT